MTAPDPAHDPAHDHYAARHPGVDPAASGWVSGWARLTHALAGPLAGRGVSPDAVTLAGVVVAAGVPAVAAVSVATGRGAWLAVAVVLVVVAAVLDGVDGALATRTGTASRWGQVVDALADRCADLLLLATLAVLGAPDLLVLAVGVLTVLLDQARSTAQAAGLSGPGRITVWERPSRVIVVSFGTALAWPGGPLVATVAAAAGLALALAGLAQLLPALRRGLAGPPGGTPGPL